MLVTLLTTSIMFTTHYNKLVYENSIMKQSLSGYGGYSETKSIKQNIETIDAIHGLDKYIWKYDIIDTPFYTYQVRVQYEKGWRYFNNQQCRNLGLKDVSSDGENQYHRGTDFVVNYDLRLKAGISGKVYSGFDHRVGFYVNILNEEHWSDKKLIRYGIEPTGKGKVVQVILKHYHLSFVNVEDGAEISKGWYIGNIGDSGTFCHGVHLHLELWIDGKNYNIFSNSTYRERPEI